MVPSTDPTTSPAINTVIIEVDQDSELDTRPSKIPTVDRGESAPTASTASGDTPNETSTATTQPLSQNNTNDPSPTSQNTKNRSDPLSTTSNNHTLSQKQHTLQGPAIIKGCGLFLSDPATCTILPAPEDHGIVFERTDLDEPVRIPALITNITQRARRSTLRSGNTTVETIEHCMSALAGLQIDNALIQIDGPELPCGDGSALEFVNAIRNSGIVEQEAPRKYHKITEPITVQNGDATLVALPCEQIDFQILFDLDYDGHEILRRQLHAFRMSHGNYSEEIAPARTFSLQHEAQALWDRGMCTHLTPEDVLVIGEDGPINNSFHFDNEPARHKVLDLIGDLYLLGHPIQGRIVAYRSGHALNHELVRQLRAQISTQQRRDLLTQKPAMDNRAIQKLLHHRYPMLMVDRVLQIEGDRKAIGIKNVTINEPFFQGHYPGTPIMPGVLIVEAMAQLSGLLLSHVLVHTGRIPILLSLDKVKLRKQVVPGDTLILEAETVRAQGRTANVRCKAFVNDTLAAEARVKFLMVDEEEEKGP